MEAKQRGRAGPENRPPSALQFHNGQDVQQNLYASGLDARRVAPDVQNRFEQRGLDNRAGPAAVHSRAGSAAGVDYNDAEYRRQLARPATVTEEPVYANNELDILTGGSSAAGKFYPGRNTETFAASAASRPSDRGGASAVEDRLWSGDYTRAEAHSRLGGERSEQRKTASSVEEDQWNRIDKAEQLHRDGGPPSYQNHMERGEQRSRLDSGEMRNPRSGDQRNILDSGLGQKNLRAEQRNLLEIGDQRNLRADSWRLAERSESRISEERSGSRSPGAMLEQPRALQSAAAAAR